jgi:hypothetical protein
MPAARGVTVLGVVLTRTTRDAALVVPPRRPADLRTRQHETSQPGNPLSHNGIRAKRYSPPMHMSGRPTMAAKTESKELRSGSNDVANCCASGQIRSRSSRRAGRTWMPASLMSRSCRTGVDPSRPNRSERDRHIVSHHGDAVRSGSLDPGEQVHRCLANWDLSYRHVRSEGC